MIDNIPESHVIDSYDLNSKGYRDLFQLQLSGEENVIVLLTAENQITYLGNTYESLPCSLSESAQNSTGEQSRPKLTIANPDGMFSLFIQKGYMDGCVVTRYRVLLPDLQNDIASFQKSTWTVSQTVGLNKTLASFELRSSLDGVNYLLPARSFYPPAFPHVSLR